jgi:hypothetical protein
MLAVCVFRDKYFYERLLSRTYFKVTLSFFSLITIINYQVFIPAYDRFLSAFLQGTLDGNRWEKYSHTMTNLEADTALVFGNGIVQSMHSFWLILFSAGGGLGIVVFICSILVLVFQQHHSSDFRQVASIFRVELTILVCYVLVESCVNAGLMQMFYVFMLMVVMLALRDLTNAVQHEKASAL